MNQTMTRVPVFLVGALSLLLFTGCATLFVDSTQPVKITTTPDSARVSIDGAFVGRAPTTVPLRRAEDHTVKATLDGGKTSSKRIESNFFPLTLLNIPFVVAYGAGLMGILVDFRSGAAKTLDPTNAEIHLEPDSAHASRPEHSSSESSSR